MQTWRNKGRDKEGIRRFEIGARTIIYWGKKKKKRGKKKQVYYTQVNIGKLNIVEKKIGEKSKKNS